MTGQSWLADLSRREFIKLIGQFSLGGLALCLPIRNVLAEEGNYLGRILSPTLDVYDQPALSGRLIRKYWKDMVVPVHKALIGEEQNPGNRFWYKVEDGYVHSSQVQIVEIRTNPPQTELPLEGQLAEVTVPFTDGFWQADNPTGVAYRLYYGTTHWITGIVQDTRGNPLYRLLDDKWKLQYYADATHFRLIGAVEVSPLSPDIPPEEKRLEVRLAEQIVVAYEADRAVYMARTSSGARFRRGNFETPAGHFITSRKRPTRHMAAGDLAATDSYDLPGVPWVCYFTTTGISFHGTFWHNEFGTPRSHGCLNLSIQDALWIYRWTTPVAPPGKIEVIQDTGTAIDILA